MKKIVKPVNKLGKQETLCWSCKKATGYCSWSACQKPVDGWNVQKTSVSYFVKDCPIFESD